MYKPSIYSNNLVKLNQDLDKHLKSIKKCVRMPLLPDDFVEFNRMVYPPIHPETKKPTDMYDYQITYFNTVQTFHKVILNKSRKIGATETALRIILYNTLKDKYSGQKVMIVAGNNQRMANKFIKRLRNMILNPFLDLNCKKWSSTDLIVNESASYLEIINGTQIEAYPADAAVRGEENVVCVFMSEAAFINKLDDTPVYNAIKPNVINIPHADFILESTPNGKRGFFHRLAEEARKGLNEFKLLELPYTVALDKLLPEKTIEQEKNNPTIDFEQEYNCRFTTSLNSAFREDDIEKQFIPEKVNSWDDIL